jgi:hypothetical protein
VLAGSSHCEVCVCVEEQEPQHALRKLICSRRYRARGGQGAESSEGQRRDACAHLAAYASSAVCCRNTSSVSSPLSCALALLSAHTLCAVAPAAAAAATKARVSGSGWRGQS